jgi:hypothetical protein
MALVSHRIHSQLCLDLYALLRSRRGAHPGGSSWHLLQCPSKEYEQEVTLTMEDRTEVSSFGGRRPHVARSRAVGSPCDRRCRAHRSGSGRVDRGDRRRSAQPRYAEVDIRPPCSEAASRVGAMLVRTPVIPSTATARRSSVTIVRRNRAVEELARLLPIADSSRCRMTK